MERVEPREFNLRFDNLVNAIIEEYTMYADDAYEFAKDLLTTPEVDLSDDELDFIREYYEGI
ncbi:MAG: hypothetical protein ACFE9S_19130 [Candidatus Hermodarchaeota archaeon]